MTGAAGLGMISCSTGTVDEATVAGGSGDALWEGYRLISGLLRHQVVE